MKRIRLEHDEWGSPAIYFAEYRAANGGGSRCVFSNLNAAIFYVVTGLGMEADWNNFPDPRKKYPYEDRNGNRPELDPVFVIKQKTAHGELSGTVTRMVAADHWIIGNGIAVMGRDLYRKATGRDEVELSGSGDRLQGRV